MVYVPCEHEHRGDEEAPHQHLPAVGAEARRRTSPAPRRGRTRPRRTTPARGCRSGRASAARGSSSGRARASDPARSLSSTGTSPCARARSRAGWASARLPPCPSTVVIAMMRGPPDGSALHGRGAEHAEHELADARGLERLVREVAVIEPGDREHADEIQRRAHDQRDRAHAHHEYEQTGRVHEDERQRAHPVDAVGAGLFGRTLEGRGPARVEPVQQRACQARTRGFIV